MTNKEKRDGLTREDLTYILAKVHPIEMYIWGCCTKCNKSGLLNTKNEHCDKCLGVETPSKIRFMSASMKDNKDYQGVGYEMVILDEVSIIKDQMIANLKEKKELRMTILKNRKPVEVVGKIKLNYDWILKDEKERH